MLNNNNQKTNVWMNDHYVPINIRHNTSVMLLSVFKMKKAGYSLPPIVI